MALQRLDDWRYRVVPYEQDGRAAYLIERYNDVRIQDGGGRRQWTKEIRAQAEETEPVAVLTSREAASLLRSLANHLAFEIEFTEERKDRADQSSQG